MSPIVHMLLSMMLLAFLILSCISGFLNLCVCWVKVTQIAVTIWMIFSLRWLLNTCRLWFCMHMHNTVIYCCPCKAWWFDQFLLLDLFFSNNENLFYIKVLYFCNLDFLVYFFQVRENPKFVINIWTSPLFECELLEFFFI